MLVSLILSEGMESGCIAQVHEQWDRCELSTAELVSRGFITLEFTTLTTFLSGNHVIGRTTALGAERKTGVQISAIPFLSSETLGKLLPYSEP